VILDVETVCVGVSINSCGRGEQDNECAKADLAGAGSSSADANAVPATSIECTMVNLLRSIINGQNVKDPDNEGAAG
jgi:hypothetical protein